MSDDGRTFLMFLMLGGCLSMPGSLGTMITLLIFSVGLYFDLKDEFPFLWFEIAETMDKFTLFVTMGQEQSTGILSAFFLITEMHTNLPDSKFVGWCFLPEPEQIRKP